ncbi:MarR family transcriptional regulator [Actinophytocola sp.]|uniref:MarR family winged helix-turn-helix transcriptional regulator n=1 Tax=Actinophytocola sp. TaxID=1872138 RepID=UPI002ED68D9E
MDPIDVILDQWRRERPDLDLTPMGVAGRIAVLARVLEGRAEKSFAGHGLRQGEFDVLSALRRSGPPYTLIPSELSATLMMSRAGMTNRLDRLEAAGLVERTLDQADRRSFRITLTPAGHEVIDAAMTNHATNLAKLTEALTEEERTATAESLRKLLVTLLED